MEWTRKFRAGLREMKRRTVAAGHFPEMGDVGALVDDDLYERDILMAAKKLDCSPLLAERINAVKDIGHISWSGGAPVARFAGNQLVNLVSIIKDTQEPTSLKVCAVRAIAEICCDHKDNKDRIRFLGLIEALVDLLRTTDYEFGELRRCATFTLLTVICDHFENQKFLLAVPGLQGILRRLSLEDWAAWEANEAEDLLRFLGFTVTRNKWSVLRSLLLK